MLVIVMLSAVGIIAVNAASYDEASAGAASQSYAVDSVAGGGVALTRCKMCESIDGIVLAMQSAREKAGQAPDFLIETAILETGLDGAETLVEPPTDARGTLGNIFSADVTVPAPAVKVHIDRPRESGVVAGYSLRESAGADSASFCFRSYRITSEGIVIPPYTGPEPESRAIGRQRAFIVAGPLECAN
jgi:hypothetical protein